MMNCQQTIEALWAYLDGEMDPGLRGELESHLGACGSCRRELEQSRRLGGVLQQYRAPSAPAGFAKKVAATARPNPFWRRVPVWRVAAAVALLAAGALVYTALNPIEINLENPVVEAPEPATPLPVQPKAPPAASREELPLVAQSPKTDEEEILDNLEVLENWEILNDPDVALALSLPDEEFVALLDALEEGM